MYNNLLVANNMNYLYHVTPLHYFVFLARAKSILSKEILLRKGFKNSHFRSTSKNADINRGFSSVVHCTNWPTPPILCSKLAKGYPHMEICINTEVLSEDKYYLCRYNIAKNRGLFTQSEETGRCYGSYKIPIAITKEEKESLLVTFGTTNHIEILVQDRVEIPDSAIIRVFRERDADIIQDYIQKFRLEWTIELIELNIPYVVDLKRENEVISYLLKAYQDESWTGSGLEFDR